MKINSPPLLYWLISYAVLVSGCTNGDVEQGVDAGSEASTVDAGMSFADACEDDEDCSDYSGCTDSICEKGFCVHTRIDAELSILTLSGPQKNPFLDLSGRFVLTAGPERFDVFDLNDATPQSLQLVCGADGKNYGHPCHAGCAGTTVEKMGGCAGGNCKNAEDCGDGFVCQNGACINDYSSCLCPKPLEVAGERRPDEQAFTGVFLHDSKYVISAGRRLYFRDESGEPLKPNPGDGPRDDYTAGDIVKDVISLSDDLLGLAVFTKGLEVLRLGARDGQLVGRTDTFGRAQRLARTGPMVFVADGLLGVGEIDIRSPEAPRYSERPVPTEGRVQRLGASGRTILLDEGGVGYGVIRYEEGMSVRKASVPLMDTLQAVALNDPSTGLLLTSSGQVVAVDLSEPEVPVNWLTADLGETVVSATNDNGRIIARVESGRHVLIRLSCGPDGEEALSVESNNASPETGGGATGQDPRGGENAEGNESDPAGMSTMSDMTGSAGTSTMGEGDDDSMEGTDG